MPGAAFSKPVPLMHLLCCVQSFKQARHAVAKLVLVWCLSGACLAVPALPLHDAVPQSAELPLSLCFVGVGLMWRVLVTGLRTI